MTEAKKESLSNEELEQVSGGAGLWDLVGEQSSLFMQDGTASHLTGEASSSVCITRN